MAGSRGAGEPDRRGRRRRGSRRGWWGRGCGLWGRRRRRRGRRDGRRRAGPGVRRTGRGQAFGHFRLKERTMPTFKHPCPYCDKFIDRAVRACPFCGQVDPFAPKRCQNCQKIVEDPAWVVCPSCGQSLIAPPPGAVVPGGPTAGSRSFRAGRSGAGLDATPTGGVAPGPHRLRLPRRRRHGRRSPPTRPLRCSSRRVRAAAAARRSPRAPVSARSAGPSRDKPGPHGRGPVEEAVAGG